jgi:hypothetical protein
VKEANGGKLAGFFDVFAWREPEEILFCEVKVGLDRIHASQRQFLDRALRLRPLSEFMIIEMPAPPRKVPAAKAPSGLAAPPERMPGLPAGITDAELLISPASRIFRCARIRDATWTTASGHRSASREPGSAWGTVRCCRPPAGSGPA